MQSVHYIQDFDAKADLELGYSGRDCSAGANDLVYGHHDHE